MSPPKDCEKGKEADHDSDQTTSESDSEDSEPNDLNQPSQFGDCSGPFFSIYSKVAEKEDNKMVKRWQKDADGMLLFTGLFAAAVSVLLSVTIPDLRPNSQDDSKFYLGKIYEVLADPNVTRDSTPSVTEPPPFSPRRYAVWVNSLWFLSLVMSVSCALWATSLHQWARRYIRLTQPARSSPEERARMRAFYANGVEKMHTPWAVEGLPALLHLSLFLFFVGLIIFLINVNHDEVLPRVVWWIALFLLLYALITLLPSILHESPYNTPLSKLAWFLIAFIPFVTFGVLFFITGCCGSVKIWKRCRDSTARYRGWMSGGVEKMVEEEVKKKSSKFDALILGWTIRALGNDDLLEEFFKAIPGLFNSELVKDLEKDFSWTDLKTFWAVLDGFMGRTSALPSNRVTKPVKSRRIEICRDIMSMIPCSYTHENLRSHFDQAPVSIERLQAMARWFNHPADDVSYTARIRVAKNLARMQERDGRWIQLASNVYGLAAPDIQRNVDLGGDNVLLAALIDVSRRAIHDPDKLELVELVEALTHFDICPTRRGLRHRFCAVWNEIVEEAKKNGPFSTPVRILRLIRQFYFTLHQGTEAPPAAFSASTLDLNFPSSYPLCKITSHRPDQTAGPAPDSRASTRPGDPPDASPDPPPHRKPNKLDSVLCRVLRPGRTKRESKKKTPIVTRGPSQASTATFPIQSSPPHSDTPQAGVSTTQQDTTSAAKSSHQLESYMQQDMAVPWAAPDAGQTSSIAPKTVSASASPSTPSPSSDTHIVNRPLTSCGAGAASVSSTMPPASSIVSSSIPTSPPPPRVLHSSNAQSPTFLSGTTPSCSTGKAAVPRPRARGLVNTGRMCFVNAVLQLLVHSSPFWNLIRELGDLKGQRGARGPETDCGATPLVDATVEFLDEFIIKEKEPPPTQQQQEEAARGKTREDERENKVMDSFEPVYLYGAMKKKGQLKKLLDDKDQDAGEFLCLYLDALHEELVEPKTYISAYKPASTPSATNLEGEAQSAKGQTEVGKRNYTASSVESTISRIFGGRSRSTVRAPNQPDTVKTELWRSLQLSIQPDSVHTIQDALVHVSKPQPVQVGQSNSSEASQQVHIEHIEVFPSVLVLHLERFLHDTAAKVTNKISKHVHFDPELEIPPEIIAPAFKESVGLARYKLYGVLYHHGKSTESGHYTVDVLHPNEDNCGGEAWLRISDEVVREVRDEDVFGGHGNELVDDDRCAYMLFYCPTASARK